MASGDLVPLPDGYLALLASLKDRVRQARLSAQRTVNTELIELYWNIGHEILTRQEEQGWGSGVVKRLAEDLRTEFPDMTGLSQRNLQYMRSFAKSLAVGAIAQLAAQLPWGHIMVLDRQSRIAADS